jgi:hypothetical protein
VLAFVRGGAVNRYASGRNLNRWQFFEQMGQERGDRIADAWQTPFAAELLPNGSSEQFVELLLIVVRFDRNQ